MFGAAILFMDVLCEMYSISNSELFDSRMDLAGNEQIVPKSNIAEIAEELLEQIPDNRFKVVISEIILGLLHKDRKIRLTVYQVEKILKIYAIRSKPLLLIQKNEECPSSISLDSSFEERIKFIHGFAEYIDTLHTNNLLQMSTDGFGCEELSQTGFECEESGYRNETPKPTIINISRPTRLNLSCSESCKAIECFKFDIKSKDNVFEYLSMKTIKRINSDDGFHSSKALDCYAFGILMLKVFFPAFSVLSINCKSLVQDLNKRDMSGMIVKDGIDISKDLIEIIASLLNGTEEIQKVVEFFDEMKGTGDIQKEGQDEVDDEATQYSGDETD